MTRPTTVHVSFSGGLDSTALLTRAVRDHGATYKTADFWLVNP